MEFRFTICATQAQLQAVQNNAVPDGKIGTQSCQHFAGKGTFYPPCMVVKGFQNQRKGGSAFVFPFFEMLIVKLPPIFVAADAVKAIKHSLERHIFRQVYIFIGGHDFFVCNQSFFSFAQSCQSLLYINFWFKHPMSSFLQKNSMVFHAVFC
ncbi:hypothetical protein [Anaerotignum lactatifermentans]|uniref:hypothetical protein n=1 Tax=Anaerotignum lactatifermentans TaxID=160404 RepID=UPI00255C6727|nr:hypothetical protein [Anaerotignum lactatifermentans]